MSPGCLTELSSLGLPNSGFQHERKKFKHTLSDNSSIHKAIHELTFPIPSHEIPHHTFKIPFSYTKGLFSLFFLILCPHHSLFLYSPIILPVYFYSHLISQVRFFWTLFPHCNKIVFVLFISKIKHRNLITLFCLQLYKICGP